MYNDTKRLNICCFVVSTSRKQINVKTYIEIIMLPYLGICNATASKLSDGVRGGFSNNRLGASVS